MRIEKLHLLAYGHFRGLELDLSSPGLHVVFGRNEAGKSTTLRAITGLLYGIDARTQDAHVHKPADLRIGGVLAADDGHRVRVVRRKGNTNTLLDDKGQPIDEAVLLRMLRGVTAETFRTAFGLDHPMLRKGAEALLAGHGDLGESLFDASIGGGGEVQRLLEQLTAEADEIYKARGTTQPLNVALRQLTDAQKSITLTQMLPAAYAEQEAALEATRAERETIAGQIAELSARRAQMDRARKRVPLQRRRERLTAERARLASLERHLPRIRSIAGGLAGYERAVAERREGAIEVMRLADRVSEAARRAGVELDGGVDGLALDVRKEGRIQRLVNERTKLASRVELARAEIARAERELAKQKEAASGAGTDVTALERAAKRGRALGDAEARLAKDGAVASRRRKELEARASALGLSGTLEAIVALRLPAVAAVDALAARAAEAERAVARVQDRVAALETERATVERQIAEHSGELAPPEQADLRAARAAREAAWARVKGGDASATPAFEAAMREADDLADRMLREADRVTTLARLRSAEAAVGKQIAAAQADEQRARAAREALDAEHAALFAPAGVVARSFGEMRAWLELRAQIALELDRLRELEAEVAEAGRAIEEAKATLREALVVARADATLSELLDDAARRLSGLEVARRAAEEVARASLLIEERASALKEDETALAETGAALAELVAPLGLAEDATAEEIARAIEALRDLFAARAEHAAASRRVAASEAEVVAFEAEVARAVSEVAPDLVGTPAHQAASTLAASAEQVEELGAELARIEEQLAEIGDEPLPEDLAELAADPEAILRAREELEARLSETGGELSRLDQKIGGLANGLEALHKAAGAADASARAQEALARVRANVERYCRAKLASVILSREIERYREEHQAPLLSRASKLFATLTLGAYVGIRAGFDDKDKPALRCVRAGGVEVDVTGLSEGTRDQLYMSLRLASLARHAEISGPMPLVLDDVLIQFDDERSRAALGVLAEVAREMQVLFFTHHARLVELAQSALPASALVVHELASSSAAPVASASPA